MDFFRIKELFDYRQMIVSLVRQDLRSRYKASVLGFLWTFINPLLQLIIYTIVFSVIMKTTIENYYVFLFVGLIPWNFFSFSIISGSTIIIMRKELVKKVFFPRQILPISYVTSSFINMLFAFIIVFGVLIFSKTGFNAYALIYLPFVMIIEYFFALGLLLAVSAVTVYFRDLEHIVGIVMMAWMYLTPIMYFQDMIPVEYKKIFNYNPMTSIINGYQQILYHKTIPDLGVLMQALLVSFLFLVVGNLLFIKLEKGFAEEL